MNCLSLFNYRLCSIHENVRQAGENCGNGWDGSNTYFCGECEPGLKCGNESNPGNKLFGCGFCEPIL